MRKFPVYEHFLAFQGEGVHMGRSAYFIRLYACDQACPWCDSAGTWHKDYRPKSVRAYTAQELCELCLPFVDRASFIVLTGGEPTLYDLEDLVKQLHQLVGKPVHLETAGHHPPPSNADWITVSPKFHPGAKPPCPEALVWADEFKVIVETPRDVALGLELLWTNKEDPCGPTIWLHPEWGNRNNPEVLQAICDAVLSDPTGRIRAGYQLHKMYNVDALSPTSNKAKIPLGGDPNRGPAT